MEISYAKIQSKHIFEFFGIKPSVFYFISEIYTEVFKVSIFEYDKEKEEKKLRKAEYEHGLEDGIIQGKTEGISIEREIMLTLLERMTTGGDGDKITELRNSEVLENMKRKYEVE